MKKRISARINNLRVTFSRLRGLDKQVSLCRWAGVEGRIESKHSYLVGIIGIIAVNSLFQPQSSLNLSFEKPNLVSILGHGRNT